MAITHTGTCFCGAVEFEVTGEPVAMGYCHCDSCRSWSATPVNAFTLWSMENVRITKGAGLVRTFSRTANSRRKWCDTCGGHLMTEVPEWKMVDVYAATIPSLPFRPAVHVHCDNMVLTIKDGLPKLRDLPKELGGSGLTLAG